MHIKLIKMPPIFGAKFLLLTDYGRVIIEKLRHIICCVYGDYSFLHQNFLMTLNGRIFGAEKNKVRFCESGALWCPPTDL